MAERNEAPALLEVDGPIATITLNRPGAYNAIDIEMARTLEALALDVEARAEVRVLVLRAAGKAFCAGGDIKLFIEHLDDLAPPIGILLKHLNGFVSALRRMPQLVVTSVQGPAAGAGFSLAFMGDFCVAAEGARFSTAYARIGIVEVDLLVGALVDDLEAVPHDVGMRLAFRGLVRLEMHHHERIGVIKHLHGSVPSAF